MAKQEKRIAHLRRNPKNVRPDELDVVLRAAGFTARQMGSSHKVYSRAGVTLSVPQRHPFLLKVYVELALDLLGDDEEEGSDDDD